MAGAGYLRHTHISYMSKLIGSADFQAPLSRRMLAAVIDMACGVAANHMKPVGRNQLEVHGVPRAASLAFIGTQARCTD